MLHRVHLSMQATLLPLRNSSLAVSDHCHCHTGAAVKVTLLKALDTPFEPLQYPYALSTDTVGVPDVCKPGTLERWDTFEQVSMCQRYAAVC